MLTTKFILICRAIQLQIMNFLNYILIIAGAFIAMYSKAGSQQNQYVLIIGIVLLMVGIYRISKTIPHKNDGESQDHT